MTAPNDGQPATYRVACGACNTSTVVHSAKNAVETVEMHHSNYGCTYPDTQTITDINRNAEP